MPIMALTYVLSQPNVKQTFSLTIFPIFVFASALALNLHLANGIPEGV